MQSTCKQSKPNYLLIKFCPSFDNRQKYDLKYFIRKINGNPDLKIIKTNEIRIKLKDAAQVKVFVDDDMTHQTMCKKCTQKIYS